MILREIRFWRIYICVKIIKLSDEKQFILQDSQTTTTTFSIPLAQQQQQKTNSSFRTQLSNSNEISVYSEYSQKKQLHIPHGHNQHYC